MITRYVPLGLLCILLFLGCRTTIIKENSTELESRTEKTDIIDIDKEINALIDDYKDSPEILIDKITALLEPGDTTYNPLLARLELVLNRFDASILRIKEIPEYEKSIDNLKIIIINKMSLGDTYTTEIEQTLSIDPYNTFVTNLKSKVLLEEGNLQGAESILQSLVTQSSTNGESYILLGDITLKKVDNLNLSSKKVLNSREEKLVESLYNEALKYYLLSNEENSSAYFVKLSSVYRKLGKKLEAIKALDRAIIINPIDPWNFYDRGKLYYNMGSTDKALADFRESYRLNPDHFFSNVYLGRLYFIDGNIEESLFHYKKVMGINPKYTPAYKDLSVLYFVSGEKEKGLNYLTSLYKSKTDRDPLLPLYLVNTLLELDRNEDAKKILENLVKYEKNSTIKGIYYYYLDPDRAGDQALNDALLFEDQYQRMRLTYYVSCALFRGGIFSLSDTLFTEVADSNIGLESKLAKYKLGVNNE